MFFLNMLILVALVQLLVRTEKPELCAAIYTALMLIFGLAFGSSILNILISTVISGILSYIYFWLLSKTLNTTNFWIVLVVGLVIGFV